jgi:nitroreductase
MDLDTAMKSRRSVRGFLRDKPVPRALIEEVLALAQRAPSNCNVQPWRVFVASDSRRDRLSERLVEAAKAGPGDGRLVDNFEGDYRRLQIACAVELYGAMDIARDDREGRTVAALRNFEFFDAPHVAIVCMDESFGVSVALDVGAWLMSFLLGLHARGIASCPQVSLCRYPDVLHAELDIPASLQVLCGVSFGFEDPGAPANQARQSREPISNHAVFLDD